MKTALVFAVPVIAFAAFVGVSFAQAHKTLVEQVAAVPAAPIAALTVEPAGMTEQDMQALAVQLNEIEPQAN